MNEANLTIARRVILCAGLLTGALLFIYPHWWLSVYPGDGSPAISQDVGRGFIGTPPLPGVKTELFALMDKKTPIRINYIRQTTEVALALAFTFGLMLAVEAPAGNRKKRRYGRRRMTVQEVEVLERTWEGKTNWGPEWEQVLDDLAEGGYIEISEKRRAGHGAVDEILVRITGEGIGHLSSSAY
jgi:hypothetical protein